MTSEPSPHDLLELRRLIDAYGLAVDTRDGERFAAVFTDDGVLAIYEPDEDDEPSSTIEGRTALAEVPQMVAGWHNTMHLMANHYCDVDGDEGTGLVYGLSLHLKTGESDVDTYMVQRYRDRYLRVDGRWRIARRDVLRQWTEYHPAERARLADTLDG
ncbi:MAG: nuclear transport factor 2 family protein [Solirubrobacteraceae bacterium]|nr:nuclear transport factor 2 family protein [Solirubrobacteraceae bacterium]